MENMWYRLNNEKLEIKDCDICIFGVPYDEAASFEWGASLAPVVLRKMSSWMPEVLETGESLIGLKIKDLGDVMVSKNPVTTQKRTYKLMKKVLPHAVPIIIGGDHSISIGTINAFCDHYKKSVGLIYIDTHADLCDRWHGEKYSHGNVMRRVLENKHLKPENVVIFGVGSFETEEMEYIKKHRIKFYNDHHVHKQGLENIAKKIIKQFKNIKNIYLSFDIDAIDPAFAPATGLPDAGGISSREAIELIKMFRAINIKALDLTEIAPNLDVTTITPFLGCKLIGEYFALVKAVKYGEKSLKFKYASDTAKNH